MTLKVLVDNQWQRRNAVFTATKLHQRLVGRANDDEQSITAVMLENHATYIYNPKTGVRVQNSGWRVSRESAHACASDICVYIADKISTGDIADRFREELLAEDPGHLDLEIERSMKDWSGEPYRSLLTGLIEEEVLEDFLAQVGRIAVMNLSSMLTAMRNAEATPALEQQQEYRGDQAGKFV